MWAKEKEAQKETIKDLPKMNQVGSIRAHNRHFWRVLTKTGPSYHSTHNAASPGGWEGSSLPLEPISPSCQSVMVPERQEASCSRALYRGMFPW